MFKHNRFVYFTRYRKDKIPAAISPESGGYPYPANCIEDVKFWPDYTSMNDYLKMFTELEACQGYIRLDYSELKDQ